MRRLVSVIFALSLAISASAQIKVVVVQEQADTLMQYFTSGADVVNVYKNQNGYFIAGESTNRFDPFVRLYLGKDKEQAVQSLRSFIDFFKYDVATTIELSDALGNYFIVKTDSGIGGTKRKPNFQNTTTIRITNEHMSGWVYYRKKPFEDMITYLSK